MDQVADGDRRAVIRHLGDVLPNVIVEREPALEGEERDARGGELLRVGADVVHHRGGVRNVVVQVRHPVPVLIDEAAVP